MTSPRLRVDSASCDAHSQRCESPHVFSTWATLQEYPTKGVAIDDEHRICPAVFAHKTSIYQYAALLFGCFCPSGIRTFPFFHTRIHACRCRSVVHTGHICSFFPACSRHTTAAVVARVNTSLSLNDEEWPGAAVTLCLGD